MAGPAFVSLRTKLLIGTILIVAVLMGAVTAVVERRQRTTIIEEVHRRGTALAESLAAVSTGALLRSEERRVGKECSLLCRSRWSPYH